MLGSKTNGLNIFVVNNFCLIGGRIMMAGQPHLVNPIKFCSIFLLMQVQIHAGYKGATRRKEEAE